MRLNKQLNYAKAKLKHQLNIVNLFNHISNYDTGMHVFGTCRGICSSDDEVCKRLKDFFIPFAKAYREICQEQICQEQICPEQIYQEQICQEQINQTNCKRKEFYGLRDFYR